MLHSILSVLDGSMYRLLRQAVVPYKMANRYRSRHLQIERGLFESIDDVGKKQLLGKWRLQQSFFISIFKRQRTVTSVGQYSRAGKHTLLTSLSCIAFFRPSDALRNMHQLAHFPYFGSQREVKTVKSYDVTFKL